MRVGRERLAATLTRSTIASPDAAGSDITAVELREIGRRRIRRSVESAPRDDDHVRDRCVVEQAVCENRCTRRVAAFERRSGGKSQSRRSPHRVRPAAKTRHRSRRLQPE